MYEAPEPQRAAGHHYGVIPQSGKEDNVEVAALESLDGAHATRLQWFLSHRQETVRWPSPLPSGDLLVSKGKAIYKPKELDYAVSVRVNLGSPYPDGEMLDRPDGRWFFSYHEESGGPQHFTNAALRRCMTDRVPVGVLRQVGLPRKKPRQYTVLGLGLPIDHRDGYFLIAEVDETSQVADDLKWPDVLMATAEATAADSPGGDIPPDDYDGRVRVLRAVHARRGQASFRRALLEAYRGACALSGCSVEGVLEAAHLRPYRGPESNVLANGLLLRADLHTLFDLGHIGISPVSRTVSISPKLTGTEYASLHGRTIAEPIAPETRPATGALATAWRYHQTQL